MKNQQEASSPRSKIAFQIIAVITAVFAVSAVIRTIDCKNAGEICPCWNKFQWISLKILSEATEVAVVANKR